MTTEAIELIGVNAQDLANWLDGAAEIVADLDDEDCVRFLAQLDEIKAAVAGAIGSTHRRLLELVPPGQSVTAPGFGKITVNAGGKERIKGAALAHAVAAQVADTAVDRETGEKIPPAVLCQRVADELLAVFPLDTKSASFRVGAVKERHLKPGTFRDWEDGEPVVRFEAG